MVDPITLSLAALSGKSFSLFVVILLKYKQERKCKAAAKQEKERRQAERDNSLYHKRKLEAAAKQEKERQAQAERDNCKDAKEKQEKERQAQAERNNSLYHKLEAAAKQEKERKAQAERDNSLYHDRKLEAAAKQEKERQAQAERDNSLYHDRKERDNCKDAKEKQETQALWDAEEEQTRQGQQEREREAKKEKKRQAKLEHEREIDEKLRVMKEEIEHEKRERIEGQRKNEMMMKCLGRTVVHAARLFMDPQQMHHSRRYNYQTLKYEEHVKSLAYFDLPEDSDKDLQTIFNASSIDNPYSPLDATESSEHLNCERVMEYDIHRLAMTTVNGHGNSQDITVLELNNQLFDDFEDDMVSSAIIPVSNAEGTRAKEEGNAYFEEQKFEEAIKCYSKSIDKLPTMAAYSNRAMAYIKLNKFIEAEQDCTDALKIDDRYFKAYERRAIARTKLGCNFEGALEDVEVALKLEPNNLKMKELYSEIMSLKAAAEARERGNKLFKDKKFEEAIICYNVSINISPTAVAYSNKAMAYLKLNKLMEAENDCTDALKIDNQCFKAYARRANARSKLGGNLKGALEDVEAALNLEPNNQDMKELHAKLVQALG